jgi:hypothetical protein
VVSADTDASAYGATTAFSARGRRQDPRRTIPSARSKNAASNAASAARRRLGCRRGSHHVGLGGGEIGRIRTQ